MLNLRKGNYIEVSNRIKKNNNKIIIYGAGMIGKVVVPYIIKKYSLQDNIDCYVDLDSRLTDSTVDIDGHNYTVKNLEYLNQIDNNNVLFITNSKFDNAIKALDNMISLDGVETYIIPIMQLSEQNSVVEDIIFDKRNTEPKIPKIIHYCWFGGKDIPNFLKRCIESWSKYCSDYEIRRWDESNYDVNQYAYTKEAYANKRYGFVTDIARWDILYKYGGIYLDTDVELIKNLDSVLYQDGFIAVEKWGNINSGGGCGFVKGHPMIKEMLNQRETQHFINSDGTQNLSTNGLFETDVFVKKGYVPSGELQNIAGITLYPPSVQHPYDYMSGNLDIKPETLSIHHFYGGWMDESDKKNREKTQKEYKTILERIEREVYG